MNGEWSDKVAVVVHHVPESEDYEGGYEAVTLTGVPHGISATGTERDSAEVALTHLLVGLRSFGFAGRVAVDDAASGDVMRRYEGITFVSNQYRTSSSGDPSSGNGAGVIAHECYGADYNYLCQHLTRTPSGNTFLSEQLRTPRGND